MQAAASCGIPITVSQVGSGTPPAAVPINASPIEGAKEWQPIFTLDEDGQLHRLRVTVLQARDQSICQLPYCFSYMSFVAWSLFFFFGSLVHANEFVCQSFGSIIW